MELHARTFPQIYRYLRIVFQWTNSLVELPASLELVQSISQMSLHRGDGCGDEEWLQKIPSYKNVLLGFAMGHFYLQTLQNAAKSFPDINIGGFQPVGYLSATTIAI